MPQSGSTVQYQLTVHLVEGAGLGQSVEWVAPEEWAAVRDKHAGTASWKVFKTHRCTPEMRAEFDAGNATGVYVFRDIRDVIVSRMKRGDKDFDRMWARTLESALTSFQKWTSLESVLVSRYDEMVADLAAEVRRIAHHLGIAVGRSESEAIASEYTVERQRERIRQATAEGRLQAIGRSMVDPASQLHVGHVRSGRTGEWQRELSRQQVALIEARAGDWLVANGFELTVPAWQRQGLTCRRALGHRMGGLFGPPRGRTRPRGAGEAAEAAADGDD